MGCVFLHPFPAMTMMVAPMMHVTMVNVPILQKIATTIILVRQTTVRMVIAAILLSFAMTAIHAQQMPV
jgi:hypothetical protein